MNLKDELMTDRGRAIGFGRVKIPKIPNYFDIEFPLFSFVVIEREDTCLPYIASCIHVPVDGYGNSVKDARVDMAENIGFLLYENFKDAACREHLWENLYLFSKSNPSSCELWDKYHALQYLCAKNGVSIDTADSTLHKRIACLEEKVEELTRKLAEKDFVISALTNTYLLEVFGHTVVEYEEPETKEVLA